MIIYPSTGNSTARSIVSEVIEIPDSSDIDEDEMHENDENAPPGAGDDLDDTMRIDGEGDEGDEGSDDEGREGEAEDDDMGEGEEDEGERVDGEVVDSEDEEEDDEDDEEDDDEDDTGSVDLVSPKTGSWRYMLIIIGRRASLHFRDLSRWPSQNRAWRPSSSWTIHNPSRRNRAWTKWRNSQCSRSQKEKEGQRALRVARPTSSTSHRHHSPKPRSRSQRTYIRMGRSEISNGARIGHAKRRT